MDAGAKTVCVDFDGTIFPWGPLMEEHPPFAGVRGALLALREYGYRIVVLTSRLSPEWWQAEAFQRKEDMFIFGQEQVEYVHKLLNKHGIPYDEITAEKVPALAYFDDRAVHVEGKPYALWGKVDRFLRREGRDTET